jgi:hypothetical protein
MQPDINQLDLLNEVVEVEGGASSEEFFQPPLPDDGEHLAILRLGDRGIKVDRQRSDSKNKSSDRTGPAFLNVHLQVKLLDAAGNETLSVFDNLSSVVMQSAGTSRLHAVLDLAGFAAPGRMTLGELKTLTETALAQNPRVKVYTQWEAQTEVPPGSKTYVTVLKGQKKFPTTDAGKFDPDVIDPKSGQACRAQARIIKYARA